MLASSSILQVFAENLKSNDLGATANNFQMTISLEGGEHQIKAGQPYSLVIRYNNISTNETFAIYEVNGTVADPNYSFVVTSPSGKDVSPDMTKIHRPFSGVFRYAPPGQIIEIKFNLSNYCKLDEVGTYKIVAKMEKVLLVAENKTFKTVSNSLNIKVVPN
jgi:hypothetical protein